MDPEGRTCESENPAGGEPDQLPICVCRGDAHYTVEQHNTWATEFILAARRLPPGTMSLSTMLLIGNLTRTRENRAILAARRRIGAKGE
jgi:hypothetical protein